MFIGLLSGRVTCTSKYTLKHRKPEDRSPVALVHGCVPARYTSVLVSKCSVNVGRRERLGQKGPEYFINTVASIWKDMLFSPEYVSPDHQKACAAELLSPFQFCPLHQPGSSPLFTRYEKRITHTLLFLRRGLFCLFQTFCDVGGWWDQHRVIHQQSQYLKKNVYHWSLN